MNQNGGLYNQYLEIKDHKVLVSFKGAISQEVLTEFGTMIKSSLSAETNTKRIFAVFVELAQNILHYSSEQQPNLGGNAGVGIIVLKEKQNLFFLSSGNLVSNQSVEKIKAKCEKVNEMNKDQLKVYHQELIRGGRPDGSKGAGLGIVDIARKCDSPVDCVVDFVDEKNSFLTLSVSFKKDNQ
ncbi:MAG: hypothetical protein IPL26_00770 [Leptospiraceae bacterium]|nr:hypothetical protein [Leptospiraceae bacterium]